MVEVYVSDRWSLERSLRLTGSQLLPLKKLKMFEFRTIPNPKPGFRLVCVGAVEPVGSAVASELEQPVVVWD